MIFKGLPFRTEWVELPDIKQVCQKIGAPPTDIRPQLDGSGLHEHYTAPFIYDSNTKRAVSDSLLIAKYLDETYPDLPTLMPPGTEIAITLFNKYVDRQIFGTIFPVVAPVLHSKLSKSSSDYLSKSCSLWLGLKLSDVCLTGSKRDSDLEQVQMALTLLAEFYRQRKDIAGKQTFLIGDTFTYADIIIGSIIHFPATILSDVEFDLEEIKTANDGTWGRVIDELEKYRGEM